MEEESLDEDTWDDFVSLHDTLASVDANKEMMSHFEQSIRMLQRVMPSFVVASPAPSSSSPSSSSSTLTPGLPSLEEAVK